MITELEEKQPAVIPPPKKSAPREPADADWGEEAEASGFKKWGAPVIIGILLAAGIGFFANAMSKKGASAPEKKETTMVRVIPLPPPPPPPPPPPQQEEVRKVEMIEEAKEEEAPDDPEPPTETALKGAGNAGMVLKSGSGSGVFSSRNTVSAERLRWSAYAGQVKSRIGQVLESHPKTRSANMQIVVHVWLDDTGRITRVKLGGSSSDSAVDAAIRDEVLPGLQISGAPPQGMPMPINMRITARRSN